MRLLNVGWRHSNLESRNNLSLKQRGERMLSLAVPQGRRSTRVVSRGRASLVTRVVQWKGLRVSSLVARWKIYLF